jgi:hypothetical protein
MRLRAISIPVYLRVSCTALALLSIGVACAGSQTARTATTGTADLARVTPFPTQPPWPTYVARDYEKAGHPAMTKKQAALIRYTLSLSKPCQAALLRYAFPDPGWGSPPHDMVLFFQLPDPWMWPHVLWTRNLNYKPAVGQAFPVPYDGAPIPKGQGTAYEVMHQSCDPSDPAATPQPR